MSLMQMSLAEASDALARREVSSAELVEATLARAERVNANLNAFLRIDPESARAHAHWLDAERSRGNVRGPLHGVPMAHKDMFFRSGVSSSCGSRVKLPIPAKTATALSRLDAAGAMQFGVLNMAEFACGPTGHNWSVGHCRNPWNTDRITGGSSSGPAASVAARANFAALGSDTAGSIRIPASACGITGLKPTYGRVSRAGTMGFSFTLDTIGPLARSAYDCAMVMNIIAGQDAADPITGTVKVPNYLLAINQPVRGLRIGVPINYFTEDIDPEIDRLMQDSLVALRDLGCIIVPVELPDLVPADAAGAIIIASEAAALHGALLQQQSTLYSKQMRGRIERGFAIPAPRYIDALRYRGIATGAFVNAVFSKVDILHAPVLRTLIPEIGASDLQEGPEMDSLIGKMNRFTRPFNYFGLPSLALPAGFTRDDMPIAIQLVGRSFSEDKLLRLGHAFQSSSDWHLRKPNEQ